MAKWVKYFDKVANDKLLHYCRSNVLNLSPKPGDCDYPTTKVLDD